jgi:PAS domain S-box-containing protein
MPDLKEAAEPMFRRVFQSGEGYAGIAYAGETPQFPGVTRHWEIDFYPIRATAEDVRQVAVIVNEITDRYKAEVALRESEERFREMANNAPVIVWVSDRSGGTTFLGKTWFTLTGQSESQALGFGWLGVVHPEDRDNVEEEFRAANAREEAYRSEYRLRQVSGDYRWVLNSANPRIAPDGAFLGYIGSLLDITERREAEELHDLLSSEAVHRAKNTMALVQAVVRQTRADNVESLRSAIQGRVAAIASAQSLLAESGGESINLLRLLERQTLVYDNDRVVLTGDRAVVLNDEAAQPFALAIHELVTNSIKYGALSVSTGRLELSWEVAPDRNLTLRWRELGGPQLKIPMRRSFGTMLIAATIERQLGGTIRYDWRAEGLTCEIAIPYSLLDPNPAAQPRPDNGSDGNA